jgi:osmotically inducible lipoprotein OsmB
LSQAIKFARVLVFIGRTRRVRFDAPISIGASQRRRGAAGIRNSEDIVRGPAIVVLLLAALTLSACGTSTGDRGLSGAAIGAGAGAAAAAILGGPIAAVALVGAGAGALTGMATSPNSVASLFGSTEAACLALSSFVLPRPMSSGNSE